MEVNLISLYQVPIIGVVLWRKRKENEVLSLTLGKPTIWLKCIYVAFGFIDSDLVLF